MGPNLTYLFIFYYFIRKGAVYRIFLSYLCEIYCIFVLRSHILYICIYDFRNAGDNKLKVV